MGFFTAGLGLGILALGILIGMAGAVDMQVIKIQSGELIPSSDLHQKVLDCQQKDYYYLDNHRTLCDNLGVTPYNNTLSEKR